MSTGWPFNFGQPVRHSASPCIHGTRQIKGIGSILAFLGRTYGVAGRKHARFASGTVSASPGTRSDPEKITANKNGGFAFHTPPVLPDKRKEPAFRAAAFAYVDFNKILERVKRLERSTPTLLKGVRNRPAGEPFRQAPLRPAAIVRNPE